MKKNFIKSFLMTGGLVMGTVGAWANAGDVKTNVFIDFSNEITDGVVAGNPGQMTIGTSTVLVAEIVDGVLFVGNGTNVVEIAEDDRAKSRDVVTFSFEMGTADGSNNYGAFEMKDAEGNNIANLKFAHWDASSTNNTSLGIDLNGENVFSKNRTGEKDVVWDKRTFFTIVFDYKNSTITTTTQINGSAAKDPVTVEMTNTNPIASFHLYAGTAKTTPVRRPKFDNLKITTTEGDYSVSTANYIVKYICNDEEIKPSATRTGDVGAAIELLASDTESFISEDASLKYKYVSDDSNGKVIAEDGTTVVTISFDAVEKVPSAKINYVCNGETVKSETVPLDNLYVGDTYNIPFHKIVIGEDNNTIYEVNKNPSGSYYTESTIISKDISITKVADVKADEINVLLNEDLDGSTGNFADIRASSGSSYDNKSYESSIELPSGRYTVLVRFENQGRGSSLTIGKDTIMKSNAFGKGSWNDNELEVIVSGGKVAWNPGVSKTFDPIDVILIFSRNPHTVEIGAAGLATYTPDRVLNFSEATKIAAYKASVDGETVNLTQVNTVAKGEGVLIRSIDGGATSEDITVIRSADAAADNAFIGTLEDIASLASVTGENGEYTNYILNNGAQGVGFYLANDKKVATGKAYLQINTASGAKPSFIGFGDDTTGINGITTVEKTGDNVFYNVNGQRVANPGKGLYILNGKKVIIK